MSARKGTIPVNTRVVIKDAAWLRELSGRLGTVVGHSNNYNRVALDDWTDYEWLEPSVYLSDDEVEVHDGMSKPLLPIYFVATTVGGAQFKSADFDPNDTTDLRLALDFRRASMDKEIIFQDSQGNEVTIPAGRLDHLIWYNVPTE